MEKYTVSGMSCAACSTKVEKAVSKLDGVDSCSVNLLTGTLAVEGKATEDEIISAVVKAGYGAEKIGSDKKSSEGKKSIRQGIASANSDNTRFLARRLIFSAFFLLILMYFSMGHMMWGWKIPSFLEGNHVAMGLLQMILSATVMLINGRFFISGTKAVLNRSPNMDTLVALGSGISFAYSTVQLFLMTDAQLRNDSAAMMQGME
ncbi:MAG: cation-translocating P-type ATPase, partial [Treponema sp.]|nr:cation-translocating P-type ATPase [Treponema sp.]